jgi:hypothetical protein
VPVSKVQNHSLNRASLFCMAIFSAVAGSVERSVERLSQRAFEGPKRDLPPDEPTPRQLTVKAIVDGKATEDQVKESLDFGLAARDAQGELKLTPLGEIALSRYPEDAETRAEQEAAAA